MNAILKVKICSCFFMIFTLVETQSQSIAAFKRNGKWGFKKGESTVIEPQYDTVFGFDQTNTLCLAGKINAAKRSINPLTKQIKIEYNYFYINPKNEKLFVRTSGTDSTTEVMLTKQIVNQYLNNNTAFVAMVGNKKFLVSKKGGTISTQTYDNINFTKNPGFYTTENKDLKNNQVYVGLIDAGGKQIIPAVYSKISINTSDSLIYCCTAGVKFNGSDDVYNYGGGKVHSSSKHIHTVSKKHVIYKLFESENSYLLFDMVSGKEKQLKAEWVYYLKNETLVIFDGDWYFYDLKTDKRFPLDKKLIKYYNLND